MPDLRFFCTQPCIRDWTKYQCLKCLIPVTAMAIPCVLQ